jgi:hypothetical protein
MKPKGHEAEGAQMTSSPQDREAGKDREALRFRRGLSWSPGNPAAGLEQHTSPGRVVLNQRLMGRFMPDWQRRKEALEKSMA